MLLCSSQKVIAPSFVHVLTAFLLPTCSYSQAAALLEKQRKGVIISTTARRFMSNVRYDGTEPSGRGCCVQLNSQYRADLSFAERFRDIQWLPRSIDRAKALRNKKFASLFGYVQEANSACRKDHLHDELDFYESVNILYRCLILSLDLKKAKDARALLSTLVPAFVQFNKAMGSIQKKSESWNTLISALRKQYANSFEADHSGIDFHIVDDNIHELFLNLLTDRDEHLYKLVADQVVSSLSYCPVPTVEAGYRLLQQCFRFVNMNKLFKIDAAGNVHELQDERLALIDFSHWYIHNYSNQAHHTTEEPLSKIFDDSMFEIIKKGHDTECYGNDP